MSVVIVGGFGYIYIQEDDNLFKKIVTFRLLFILVKQVKEKEKSSNLTIKIRKVNKTSQKKKKKKELCNLIQEFECQDNPQAKKEDEDGH